VPACVNCKRLRVNLSTATSLKAASRGRHGQSRRRSHRLLALRRHLPVERLPRHHLLQLVRIRKRRRRHRARPRRNAEQRLRSRRRHRRVMPIDTATRIRRLQRRVQLLQLRHASRHTRLHLHDRRLALRRLRMHMQLEQPCVRSRGMARAGAIRQMIINRTSR